jgi:hypothetical protein
MSVQQYLRKSKVISEGGRSGLGETLKGVGAAAGAAIGGYFTGGAGAAQGALIGGGLGDLVGGFVDKPQAAEYDQPKAPVQVGASDAMSRRMNEINSSNLGQINASIDSLKYVQDPYLRDSIAKDLTKARSYATMEA